MGDLEGCLKMCDLYLFLPRHLICRVSISLESRMVKRLLGLLMMGLMVSVVGCGKGRPTGPYVEYYENGQVEVEGNYKDGVKDGKHVGYYKNGQILVEGNYKDGKEDGKWVGYYSSGEIKREENYKDGQRVGKWVEYYRSGEIKKEENY